MVNFLTNISPEWIGAYGLLINVITFFLYGMDKWKARRSKWRIPESTLIWMAVLGGSIGALLGIRVWHHKTLHPKFRYGVPAIFLTQLAITLAILFVSLY